MDNIITDYFTLLYRYTTSEKFKDDFLLGHYTSIDTLEKILQFDKIDFRFTESTCMADYTEGQEIDIHYNNVLDFLKNYNIDQEYLYLLRNINLTSQNSTEFIACFSSSLDDLNMWNYYGKTGNDRGVCIEFKPSFLNMANLLQENSNITSYSNINTSYSILISPVIYEDEQKTKIIAIILRDIYDNFYIKYKSNDNSKLNEIIIHLIQSIMKSYRLLFKNSKFNSEHEYRMIISLQNINIPDLNIETITSNGIKKRYIHFYFKKETARNNIEFITLSPPYREDMNQRIATHLDNNNFNHVNIKTSNIPIRF
jgi:hypothetical protein